VLNFTIKTTKKEEKMLFKTFNVTKLFVLLVFIFIGSLTTLKAQEATLNLELLWEVQNKYCIDAIIVRDAAPNEIVFSTKDLWYGPPRVWKMTIDPNTGALISVEEKQNLSPNEHIEYTLFECSDGSLFTGAGWLGYNRPFYSTDGGENWQQANSGSITNSISTYDFAEFKGNIYACTGYGGYYCGRVHRWLGNGSWEEVLRIQSRTIARNLLVYGNELFVGFLIYGGSGYQNSRPVYVSSDGSNFAPTEGIPVNYNVVYLFVVNGQLVAWVNNNNNSTERYVYLWNGTSWELLGEYTLQEGRFHNMAVTDGSAIYDYGRLPGDSSKGVYRSMDKGLTWEQMVEIEEPDACSLHIHDNILYLGTYSDASNKAYIYRLRFNEPPTAVCKDIELAADENCQTYITASTVDGGSYDPDEGDEITLSLDNTGPFSPGTHYVELTVTDQSGESDSCFAQVTVKDQSSPVISISDPLCVQTGNGKGNMANKLSLTSQDNCSDTVDLQILNVEVYNNGGNPVSGNGVFDVMGNDIYVYPNGNGWSLKVTVEALDASGNTTVETFFKNLLKCKK
jgi:hypothetical protein